ncbi:MAG: hypothetical protein JW801_00250 [Bacteroidales bacterium]|nr:hypothetical protein [Bacteroidales bacterium]
MKNRTDTYRRAKGFFCLFVLGLFIGGSAWTQTSDDKIILSAMQDELQRNFTELYAEDMDRPFFIGYTIADVRTVNISATLGSLNYSGKNSMKDWHVRLMAGDYKINDENFYSSQPDEAVFRYQIPMPVDADYDGIRRSLWLTTNNLFFSASRNYKNKMALIEDKQILASDLQIDDFSREPVIKRTIPSTPEEINIEDLEKNARWLSAIFRDYPEIFSSSVQMNVFQSTVYFVNSEGSQTVFPFCMATLTIQASTMADDSDNLSSDIVYVTRKISEWPTMDKLGEEVEVMISNLVKLRETPRFEEDYFGPVLVIGEVAAETLERFLFSGNDALIANRETLQSGNQRSVFYAENENSLQSKVGKPILGKNMTITAEPFLRTYKGIELLGNFEVDAEAVVPPEKLVLVENGVLKTLLNGRTPSREVPNSNGHMRFDYSQGGLTKAIGPGVIRISATDTMPVAALKEELISQAKELGLDYAIMIKSLDVGGSDKPINFYKIDVNTGEEILTRAVKLRNLSRHSFRRAPIFSDEVLVHNTLLPSGQGSGVGNSGIPSSFIVPKAVLLKEVEIESYRKSLTSLLPLIENPVGIERDEEKAFSQDNE